MPDDEGQETKNRFMAKYTKKLILQTFEEMLNEMPFDKITVTGLTRRCGVSSNAFYYNYQDIYDLLDAWLEMKRQKYSSDPKNLKELADTLKAFLHEVKASPKAVYHIASSISRERLERYIFEVFEPWFYEEFSWKLAVLELPEKKIWYLSQCCCYSALGLFLKFLWLNTDIDIDEEVDCFCETFESYLQLLLGAGGPDAFV